MLRIWLQKYGTFQRKKCGVFEIFYQLYSSRTYHGYVPLSSATTKWSGIGTKLSFNFCVMRNWGFLTSILTLQTSVMHVHEIGSFRFKSIPTEKVNFSVKYFYTKLFLYNILHLLLMKLIENLIHLILSVPVRLEIWQAYSYDPQRWWILGSIHTIAKIHYTTHTPCTPMHTYTLTHIHMKSHTGARIHASS